MVGLENELIAIYKQIEQAKAAGDDPVLQVLLERQQIICRVLVALDQAL